MTVEEAPDEELTRLLASTEAVRGSAAERIPELVASLDFVRLAERLELQRLAPLICSRLTVSEVALLPSWLRGAVDAERLRNWRTAGVLEAMALDAVTRLEQQGIESIPLKGPGLARLLYGDVGVRSANDVDLLVRPTQLDHAREVLVRAGYGPPSDPLFAGRPLLHFRLGAGGGPTPYVELHWRVHWYESAFPHEFLDRSRPDGLGYREPDPTLGLVVLLLFWVRDGLVGLRYPTDIAAWWDRFNAEIELAGLEAVSKTHPALRRALRVSSRAADLLVGLPADYLWGEALTLDRREALALRLVNWTIRGDPDQVEANRVLIDWLVAPPGAWLPFLRRQVFFPAPPRPPGTVSAPVWQRSVHRFTHPAKLALRGSAALWSIRRGRSWAPSPSRAPRD